jgi:hypothetical protein
MVTGNSETNLKLHICSVDLLTILNPLILRSYQAGQVGL